MHLSRYMPVFFTEAEKTASNAVSAAELLGLGTLAIPGIKTLSESGGSKKEKTHAGYETAGLGLLAAHPAYELGKSLLTKRKFRIG
jgi:hypothetical protein